MLRDWWLRLIRDERVLPRDERGRHPIPDDYPVDNTAELHRLKCLVARLWDQVWWMQLPWYRRLFYRLHGFRSPIRRFYLRPGEDWK